MGEADLAASVGFLVGGANAHQLVGAGLGPLVGRAMSRGFSRGTCELRKSLDSLSANGCGCVPTLLTI